MGLGTSAHRAVCSATDKTFRRTNGAKVTTALVAVLLRRRRMNITLESRHDGATRRRDASRATFPQHYLDHPFAQGIFRWVAKGTYTIGERVGQARVCKWFKTGSVTKAHFFETDLKTSEKAAARVCKWFKTGSVTKAHFFETDLKTSEKAVDIISQFISGGSANIVVQVNLRFCDYENDSAAYSGGGSEQLLPSASDGSSEYGGDALLFFFSFVPPPGNTNKKKDDFAFVASSRSTSTE
eukprot:CAMPEP_0119031440 /NCGR_PEP_ID=MMETSP1176-20130426/41545_1 /TAXON_ID=265551 /ORGANISM="Synedropsis recta cf, Strain CCMP1620" /LENGTH=239 /DNA_ID=CAMNT_0006987835 /DNA_START=63 /DNA_END=784 /DNA_ORIENTATION=+